MFSFLIIAVIMQSAPLQAVEDPVSVPMNRSTWDGMTYDQKQRYALVTVQALKLNPTFAECSSLDPEALHEGIDKVAERDAPLMMGVAMVAYSLCDDKTAK